MKIGDKIRQIRKANKMTLSELALRVDSDVGNLSRLERGMQGYSETLIQKIAEALSVPVSELFSSNDSSDTVETYSVSSIIKKGRKDVYRIDVLDVSASAGDGSPSKDVVEVIRSIEYVPDQARVIFGNRPESSVKLINVRGDSMEGTIDPGDFIFVDTTVNYFEGDGIYVFVFGRTIHIKRLQMQKNCLVVLSDNKLYSPWQIDSTDEDQFHVLAKVLVKQSAEIKRFA